MVALTSVTRTPYSAAPLPRNNCARRAAFRSICEAAVSALRVFRRSADDIVADDADCGADDDADCCDAEGDAEAEPAAGDTTDAGDAADL